MALHGNGRLLVKVRAQPFAALASATPPFSWPGYTVETLSPPPHLRPAVAALAMTAGAAAALPTDHWQLATPPTLADDPSPWDAAHAAARAHGYAHYVEPDIRHDRRVPPPAPASASVAPAPSAAAAEEAAGPPVGQLYETLNDSWPPHVSVSDGVSPGWYLSNGYAGFASARSKTTGRFTRIAHLDTGYTPGHVSVPRHIRPDLAYDFWDDKPGATDPGTDGIADMPGHGTATLAILAGNAMSLTFGKQTYSGDVGGAPDAEIVPVRISPSVMHVYTSTMAKGLYYALAPSGDPKQAAPPYRCDVVSISHGGLPTAAWADAVNMLYEAGIVIVAASGDSFYLEVIDAATRYTVYPSAFNRVLTAVGATYAKQPYATDKLFVMQGCWGPDAVMEKAIAAFTPNLPWMRYDRTPAGFDMNGGGTSVSTPQIAAACALWLDLYATRLPTDWSRVEACRIALFDSADDTHPDKAKLGWGLLDVARALDESVAVKAVAAAKAGKPSAEDSVSFPFWRLLLGIAPPDSGEERMYETEVAQIVLSSDNPALRAAGYDAANRTGYTPAERQQHLANLRQEPLSAALRQRIASLP